MKTKTIVRTLAALLVLVVLLTGCAAAPGAVAPPPSTPPSQTPSGPPAESAQQYRPPPHRSRLAANSRSTSSDVGQGDSVLIQAPYGKFTLIDGGPKTAGPTVVSYLRSIGVKELALVIATHPHEDHIGGLIDVRREFTVGKVIDSAVATTTRTQETYLGLIKQKGIKFVAGRAGMSEDLGGGSLQVLYPKGTPPAVTS